MYTREEKADFLRRAVLNDESISSIARSVNRKRSAIKYHVDKLLIKIGRIDNTLRWQSWSVLRQKAMDVETALRKFITESSE
jgi:transposase-like protein